MVESKKITKVLCKDKKIKEAVKNGQDAVAVFGTRLFNTTYEQVMNSDDPKAIKRYNVALAIATAITIKDSGYLIEADVADMFESIYKVEAPKKATTKKPAAKKTTTKKASK